MITATAILDTFPHPVILATHAPDCKPSYDCINATMTQLHANATSAPDASGNGCLGHLVLTLGHAAYQATSIAGVDYPHQKIPALNQSFQQTLLLLQLANCVSNSPILSNCLNFVILSMRVSRNCSLPLMTSGSLFHSKTALMVLLLSKPMPPSLISSLPTAKS